MDINNLVGEQIGNYILTSQIGSGGFGSVYFAEHLYLERKTAIKALNAKSFHDQAIRKTFFQEAKFLEMLKHRYVLPIVDVGRHDFLPYIMMEFARGGSLAKRIKDNPRLPMWEVLLILTQIGQALQYAHLHSVVHRDIKPDNILFNDKGEAVLADFGISVLTDRTISVTMIEGTFPYMAAEQFEGKVSQKSDQYALACIAYQLFTGQLPIVAQADFAAWAYRAANDVPLKPSQLNPDIPQHIERAILKALSKDRNQRFKDVGAFITSLVTETQFIDIAYLPTSIMKEEMQQTVQPIERPVKTTEEWLKEGNGHYYNNNLTQALASYEHAILISPDKDILHNVKGRVLFDLRRYREALEAYEEAIRLAPDKAIFHLNKGDVHYQLRAYEEALTAYAQAITLAPSNSICARAYAGKADAHLRLGQEKEALNAYQQACTLESGNPRWHRTRGDLLRQLHLYGEALEAYEQALQYAPQEKSLLTRKDMTLQLLKRTIQ